MIKPKNAELGVSKVNENNNQAPRPKTTVSMLLEKYTSRKADNVCYRLGGNKGSRFPSRPGEHKHGRENQYNQPPYFLVAPIYWGCSSHMYPSQLPWTPYPTEIKKCFQPGWIPSRLMPRPYLHKKELGLIQRLDHVMLLVFVTMMGSWFLEVQGKMQMAQFIEMVRNLSGYL
jgi:hypothetical protein